MMDLWGLDAISNIEDSCTRDSSRFLAGVNLPSLASGRTPLKLRDAPLKLQEHLDIRADQRARRINQLAPEIRIHIVDRAIGILKSDDVIAAELYNGDINRGERHVPVDRLQYRPPLTA